MDNEVQATSTTSSAAVPSEKKKSKVLVEARKFIDHQRPSGLSDDSIKNNLRALVDTSVPWTPPPSPRPNDKSVQNLSKWLNQDLACKRWFSAQVIDELFAEADGSDFSATDDEGAAAPAVSGMSDSVVVVGGAADGDGAGGEVAGSAAGAAADALAVPVNASNGSVVDADTAMKEMRIVDDGPIGSTDPRDPNHHVLYSSKPAQYRLLGTHMDSSFKKIDAPQERLLLKTLIVQLLMHPEGTLFRVDGRHEIPKTLAQPATDATEQPRSEALSVVTTMDLTLPVSDSGGPVQYQQWLLYALMQFGKTKATLLVNWVLHATKAIIPAILLENRNSTESQRKFIMDMRDLVNNVRRLASWILDRDEQASWVHGRRCFPDVAKARFLEKLDLKLRAKTLKVEDLTGCPRQPISADEAKHHVGIIEIETEERQDPLTGETHHVRKLKGGENQGVVMLCNKTNVEQLLGVMTSGRMTYEGLISVLIGQSKTMTVGAVQGRGGIKVVAESAYSPYAKSFSRLLISIDEAGTLFGSKDKLGAEHKKATHIFDTPTVGDKLMDEAQCTAELLGGAFLRRFNKTHTKRELFMNAMDDDSDDTDELQYEDERAQRARRRAAGEGGSRDDDDVSELSVRDDDEMSEGCVADDAELSEREQLELEQAETMMNLLKHISCAGSAVFGIFMVDATPFRTVLERDLNQMATTSTRVLQPQASPSYIGFNVQDSPQASNPFHIIVKNVQQPSTMRTASEPMMRLLFLEAQEIAQKRTDGSYAVESDCFKYEPATEGDVSSGQPATQLNLTLAKKIRVADGVDKELLKRSPRDPRLPANIADRYKQPINWDDAAACMPFEDFVNVVNHPDSGMHAYIAAVKEHNKLQPQENEYQRLEPALSAVLADWDTPERSKATGLHLLWAPTDAKTSNYELFYLLRNMLSQEPLHTVDHVHGVLFNGGGTALQIVVPKPRYDAGFSPNAMDLFDLLQRDEFRLLWQKRITNAEKHGVGKKKQDGPCFKVPVTFNKRYRNEALAGKRPAFTHTDVPAIQYPVLDEEGEEDESKKDDELDEKLRKASCETGEDTGIYACEFDDRVILMFVSRESDISSILSLDCAVHECKLANWQSALGPKPIHKTVTVQSMGLSRGQSVKTIEHGHPVTDLIRNKPFEPNTAKMSAQMTLDEEAQALGRLCELRFCVPPEVLRECQPGRMFAMRGYDDPVHGPYRWVCDNRKYAWLNENYRMMIEKSMHGTQQLMNTLEADAASHASTEAAAATAIATADQEDQTEALFSMLKAPLCYKYTTVKEPNPDAGLTDTGRQRCIRRVCREPVYLPLGGAPRLSSAFRQKIGEGIGQQPAASRRAEPPPLPIRSYLRQEEERAADSLREAQTVGAGGDAVQGIKQKNAEIRAVRDEAEAQMRVYERREKAERAKAKREASIRKYLREPNAMQTEIERVLPGYSMRVRQHFKMLLRKHYPDRSTKDFLSRLGYIARAICEQIHSSQMCAMTTYDFLRLDEEQVRECLQQSAKFREPSSAGMRNDAIGAWRLFMRLNKLDGLEKGAQVRLHGLMNRPDLNGLLGEIISVDEDGRVVIRPQGPGNRLRLKPDNVEMVNDAHDEVDNQ